MRVDLVIRAKPNQNRPDFPVVGQAPYATCPLAVTPVVRYSEMTGKWLMRETYQVTHRPTGYQLGGLEFDTQQDAMEFLERCDPTFAAWAVTTDDLKSPANMACKMKFDMACGDA